MKIKLALIMALLSLTLGCSLINQLWPSSTPSAAPPTGLSSQIPASERRCGDRTCDGPENADNCPSDCSPGDTPEAPSSSILIEAGPGKNTYWVTNPTSGAKLYVGVLYPDSWNGEDLPTLILVPGGTGTIDPNKARRLVEHNFTIVFFDPDGRGRSEGSENLGGHTQQDGLAAVIQAGESLPGVDASQTGLVSFSYGITMATGALARYPDLPVRFLIDWEGPADRQDTTVGCQPSPRITWPDCSDEAAWSEREALTFIAQVRVPYQRAQSEVDHVQPDVNHAINMINAAVQGGVPWVRLNALPPNQTYDLDHPPAMLPEKANATLEELIAQYAQELLAIFL